MLHSPGKASMPEAAKPDILVLEFKRKRFIEFVWHNTFYGYLKSSSNNLEESESLQVFRTQTFLHFSGWGDGQNPHAGLSIKSLSQSHYILSLIHCNYYVLQDYRLSRVVLWHLMSSLIQR